MEKISKIKIGCKPYDIYDPSAHEKIEQITERDILENIEVEAHVDDTIGTPNVTVVKGENKITLKFSGLKGESGIDGENAIGIQGPKGDKGDTGEQGPQGPQGEPGYDGKTGKTPVIGATATYDYSVAEHNPHVHVDVDGEPEHPIFNFRFSGLRGLDGADGQDGRNGRDGVDGQDGKDGKDGQDGAVAEITQQIIDDIKTRVLAELDGLDESIKQEIIELISTAEFWQDKLPQGQTGSESNFGQQDVENYLQQIGVWTTDGNGNRITSWSKIAQDVSGIAAEVAQLKAGQSVGGEIDYEALSGALYTHITGNTITSGLQATWAHFLGLSDDTLTTLEWMAAGVKSSVGGNADSQEAITTLFAAARNYQANKDNYDQAWAGVNAIVEPDQNNPGSYVAKGELVTLIQNAANSAVSTAGFATQSDVDTAVASMFAEGGAGRAYVTAAVDDEMSNVTISADQIELNGQTWADVVQFSSNFNSSIQDAFSGNGNYNNVTIDSNAVIVHGSTQEGKYDDTSTISPDGLSVVNSSRGLYRTIQVTPQGTDISSSGGYLDKYPVTAGYGIAVTGDVDINGSLTIRDEYGREITLDAFYLQTINNYVSKISQLEGRIEALENA